MWVCPRCRTAIADGRFCPLDGAALRLEPVPAEPRVPGLVLDRELGRGLTGTVWRARDAAGRAVAVKLLHREWADHDEMRERFLREARAAAAIDHPGVVAPLATGVLADGRPYLVMELVDGPSLEEVLALGPLPEARAAAIGRDLADALAAVHRADVVHRDVKPSNVRIDRAGRARLLDFGVARRLDADEARLTGGGLTVGTPHYMAPEQCTGDPITGRADVYALGVLLFRVVAGEVPFDGAAVAVMLAHTSREAPALADRAAVSPAFADLVARCLAKRPGDRPAAAELAAALAALAGEPVDPLADTRVHAVSRRAHLARAATVPAPDDDADDVAAAAAADPTSGTVHAAPADTTSGTTSARANDLARFASATSGTVRAKLASTTSGTVHAPDTASGTAIARRAPARRRSRARLVVGGLIAAAVAIAVVATPVGTRLGLDLPRPGHHAAAAATPSLPEPAPPVPEPAAWRRFLVASDVGVVLRLGAPVTMRAGAEHELTIEAWDDEGAPIDTTDLVVTFADPDGDTVGLAADPTLDRGVYRVRSQFDRDGAWTVRVFPPRGDAMVTFTLEIGEAIPTS